MCSISFIMGEALTWPTERWKEASWRNHFETLAGIAKKYDTETGQPDCESEEKKKAIQEIANQLGVEIKFPE